VGEYTFFAKNPGKTTLTLIVIRADNLAVGTTEVQVEITDRRWGEGENSVDVEFRESLVEFLERATQATQA